MQLPRDDKGRLNSKLVGVLAGSCFAATTEFVGLVVMPRVMSKANTGWKVQLALAAVIGAVWVAMGTYLVVSYGRGRADR